MLHPKLRLRHETSDKGSHRIVRDTVNGPVGGDWVGYQNYASMSYLGMVAIAVTDYFAGGLLTPGVVYFAYPSLLGVEPE